MPTRGPLPPHLPSVHPQPLQFPNYPSGNQPPGQPFADRKQVAPLFKMAKTLLKTPKKVLPKRNTPVRKKFRVL